MLLCIVSKKEERFYSKENNIESIYVVFCQQCDQLGVFLHANISQITINHISSGHSLIAVYDQQVNNVLHEHHNHLKPTTIFYSKLRIKCTRKNKMNIQNGLTSASYFFCLFIWVAPQGPICKICSKPSIESTKQHATFIAKITIHTKESLQSRTSYEIETILNAT